MKPKTIILFLLFPLFAHSFGNKNYYTGPYKDQIEIIGADTLTFLAEQNKNAEQTGIWLAFDKKNQLVKEIEVTYVSDQCYILKETKYINGTPTIISEKNWFEKFYLKNVLTIAIIILSSIFIRYPLNSFIVESEYGKKPPTHFVHDSQKIESFTLLIYWWDNVKSNYKYLKIFSNALFIVGFGGFFTILIGLALSGAI